jgi:hypothetical protein
MIQRTFERVRRIELKLGVEPSHYEPGGGGGSAVAAHGADDPSAVAAVAAAEAAEASPAGAPESVPS